LGPQPGSTSGKNDEETASASDSGENRDNFPEANALPVSVRTTQCALEIETPMHRCAAFNGTGTCTGVNKLLKAACPNLKHTGHKGSGEHMNQERKKEKTNLLSLLLPQTNTRPLLVMAALLLGPA
jgi:hypothetical protein